MFLLSCGRNSVAAEELSRDDSGMHASLTPSQFMTSIPPIAELGGVVRGHRRSNSTNDAWLMSSSLRSEEQIGDAPPFRRLDTAMSNYYSMAARIQSANRSDFPALWTAGRSTSRHKEHLGTASDDSDEIPIPDLHVGMYQFFCQPQTWSSVFASPGDFTIRMDSVYHKNNEVIFRIAVICSTVRAVREGAPTVSGGAGKRKSFVKFIERTESELVKFAETMALKYIGHRLMEKLPTIGMTVLSSSQKRLNAHGEAVVSFLTYLLTITEIGYNRLVILVEPIVKNLFVREFLDLSLGFGDPGMVSTSSCDARLERRADDRPMLPSAWLEVLDNAQSKSFSYAHGVRSPRSEPFQPARRLSDSGYEYKVPGTRSPTHRVTFADIAPSMGNRANARGKCTRFVRPNRWHVEKFLEGAFTVEVAGVTIIDGRARYTICVLCYVAGQLEMTTVDRRFSEFDVMVNRVERKLRALPVRNHFPTKTLFRYLSVSYLERRAAYLQRFLEKLLQMRFLGVLDQEISMVAEPNVRKFLRLPQVQWNITPWHQNDPSSPRTAHHAAHARVMRELSSYSASPTIVDESPLGSASPHSSGGMGASPYGINHADYDSLSDFITPRYQTFSRGRSGSM